MKRLCYLVPLILVLTVSAALAAGGKTEPASGLAAAIQKRYRGIESLKADYRRLSRFVAAGALSRREVRASGRLYWARPARLRLEQDTPRRELIVAGEHQVWWVRPSRKRADLYPVEQFTSGLKPLLEVLGGLASLERSFRLLPPTPQEQAFLPGCRVLALAPKVARADLKRLVIWVDAGDLVLRGFRIVNIVGDLTQYRLENVQVNPSLSPDLFTYQPPEGYRVREQRPIR